MAKSFASSKRQVFLSYRRSPASLQVARELRAALEAEGLVVWLDERDIDAFEDIPDAMRDGLRASHALVALYDEAYAGRRACQWELTEALIATAGGVAERQNRVFVVAPSRTPDHVRPRTLRRALISLSDEAPGAIARSVRRQAEGLRSTIGKARRPQAKPWVGLAEHGSYERFVGRTSEMWEIFDALSENVVILDGRAAAPRFGSGRAHLHAWGGVGKSLLAAEYARRFAPFYPGGVFWLKAGEQDGEWRATLAGALRTVAEGLTTDLRVFDYKLGRKDNASGALNDALELIDCAMAVRRDPPTEADRTTLQPKAAGKPITDMYFARDYDSNRNLAETLVRARASIGLALAQRNRCYLWIIDDLPEGAGREQQAAWAAPDDEGLGRTLYTTRDGSGFDVGIAIPIGMLEADSAYDLLTFARKPQTREEEAAARDFLAVVDHYALIVDVAGRLVGGGYFPGFADLLDIARNPLRDARLLNLDDGLRLALPGDANPNILATLLRSFDFLAALPAGALALDLLRFASMLHPNAPIAHDWLEEALGQDLASARFHLTDLALAQADLRGLIVHPVVCRAVALSSPQPRLAELRVRAVATLTARLDLADEVDDLRTAEILVGHASALLAQAEGEADAILLGRVAGHHYVAGRAALAETLFRRQLKLLEVVLEPDHADLLTPRANLAGALRAQAKTDEALLLQREVLARSRAILGAEHRDTLSALNNLAETVRAKGDLDSALAMHDEAFEARRRLFGEEDPATLTSLSNLAGVRHARGELEDALALRRKISALHSRDPESYDALVAMSNLAETLRALDRVDEARPVQVDVVAGFRRLLGEEHPDTLTARNNLALMQSALGWLDEAALEMQSLAETRERSLGASHPDTLMSRLNLAQTWSNAGQHEKALALAEQTARAMEQTLGRDHPDTLNAVSNLGAILYRLGEDGETARVLLERALQARRRVLGPTHPATLVSMTNLAGVRRDQGDLLAARELYREATEGFLMTLGASHVSTRAAMSGYAQTLLDLGEFAKSCEIYERLLAFHRQYLGEAHRETLDAMNELALARYLSNDKEPAEGLYRSAMEIARRAYGATDPATLLLMGNLAGLLEETDEWAAALTLREEIAAARLKAPGLPAASTVESLDRLARTLTRLSHFARAKAMWAQALPAAVEIFGEGHEFVEGIRAALHEIGPQSTKQDDGSPPAPA